MNKSIRGINKNKKRLIESKTIIIWKNIFITQKLKKRLLRFTKAKISLSSEKFSLNIWRGVHSIESDNESPKIFA